VTRGRITVYNCCWSSPPQSFSGPSPTGLNYITVSDMRLFSLGGHDLHIYSLKNRFAHLYPQAMGSLFIASNDSLEVFEPASHAAEHLFPLRESCFVHLSNTSGHTEKKTLSLTHKRQRRRQLLGTSGKHDTTIRRQWSIYYFVCVGNSMFLKIRNKIVNTLLCVCVWIPSTSIVAGQRFCKRVPTAKNALF
jgi:hypothetical protein